MGRRRIQHAATASAPPRSSALAAQRGRAEDFIAEVEPLILQHEFGGSPDGDLLQAADSLSFLEVNGRLVVDWVRRGDTSLPQGIEKLDWMYERIKLPRGRELARPYHEQAVAVGARATCRGPRADARDSRASRPAAARPTARRWSSRPASVDWIYVAGQTPRAVDGAPIPADLAGQTERCFHQIEQVLGECGATLADVVQITVYLTDLADYATFAEVRGRVFGDAPPVERRRRRRRLLDGALVEISAVAATS